MSKKKKSKVNDNSESELANILNESMESSEENNVDDPPSKEVDLTEKVRDLANRSNIEFAKNALKGNSNESTFENDLKNTLKDIDYHFGYMSSIFYAPPPIVDPNKVEEQKPKKRHVFILLRLFRYLVNKKNKKEKSIEEIAFSNVTQKDINKKFKKLVDNLFKDKEKEQGDLYDINITKAISRAQAYDFSSIRIFGVNIIGNIIMVILNNIWSLESRLGCSFVTKTHTTLILLFIFVLIVPVILYLLVGTLINNFYNILSLTILLILLFAIVLIVDTLYTIITYLRD